VTQTATERLHLFEGSDWKDAVIGHVNRSAHEPEAVVGGASTVASRNTLATPPLASPGSTKVRLTGRFCGKGHGLESPSTPHVGGSCCSGSEKGGSPR
jgi:hypothetical protein